MKTPRVCGPEMILNFLFWGRAAQTLPQLTLLVSCMTRFVTITTPAKNNNKAKPTSKHQALKKHIHVKPPYRACPYVTVAAFALTCSSGFSLPARCWRVSSNIWICFTVSCWKREKFPLQQEEQTLTERRNHKPGGQLRVVKAFLQCVVNGSERAPHELKLRSACIVDNTCL